MRAVLGVGKFGQMWSRLGKGGQVSVTQTEQVWKCDMASGWGWVSMQV